MEWGPVCMCPGHPPLPVPDGLPSEIKPQSSFCSATNVGAGPHPSYRVTLGNIFCSVICFSYTEHPFTSILAECGSGCPSTLPSAYASPLLAPSPPHTWSTLCLPSMPRGFCARWQPLVAVCSRVEVGLSHSHVQSVADRRADL